MINRKISVNVIFCFFSLIHVAFVLFFNLSYFTYVIFAYLVLIYSQNRIRGEEFLICALCIPNKYLQLLAVLLFLLLERKMFRGRLNKKTVFFMAYILIVSIINCVLYQGLFFSSLFQMGIYYCVFRLIEVFKEDFKDEIVYRVFDQVFWLQCIAAFLQLCILQTAKDSITGTLISAHYLGVFLVVYMYVLLDRRIHYISFSQKMLRFFLCISILILSDAKHIWILFLFSLLSISIMKKIAIKNKITVGVLSLLFGIFLILVLTKLPVVKSFLGNSMFSTYVYNERYNKKYEFFCNTLEEMNSWQGLWGFGVGQFGSQISLTMSKGIIYAWDSALEGYSFAIRPYWNAIDGVMTEWYTKYGIGVSSMVLGYPLVSFAGFVGELGIIGFFLLLQILDKSFKDGNKVFMLFFFMISVFDTYFEIPCVFVTLLIAGTYHSGAGRTKKEEV